jgi:dienelactone hydrolase
MAIDREDEMDRREFLQSATLVASAAGAATALAATAAHAAGETAPAAIPQPVAKAGEPMTRRWLEQRWLIDNIIKANGIDWDQPRSIYLNAPCGFEAGADFAAVRQRVQKYADVAPAFEAGARRREAKALAAQEAQDHVSARENYFVAAVLWAAAQWPIDQANEQNIAYNRKKRECYEAYGKLADHKVETAWVPFQGKALPAWFHLPPGYSGGKIPSVWTIAGMDGCKEAGCALYGDRFLNRGIAVLAIDGPGSYESPLLGIHASVPNWQEAGRAIYGWLAARPEIDPQKIGIVGASFGSFYGTVAGAAEPRHALVAASGTCLEPGCHTIFEEASPTFKKRYMFMAGIDDEAKFNEFMKTLSLDGIADKLKMPYLIIAGEADELSPLEFTDRQLKQMTAPRQLVVYQDSRHSVGGVPAAVLGPSPSGLLADWVAARFAGKPFKTERWFVDAVGRVTKTAL